MLRTTLASAAIALASTSALGAAETYVGSTTTEPFNFTGAFQVPQFDSMGGARTLERVDVWFDVDLEGVARIENQSLSTPQTFETTVQTQTVIDAFGSGFATVVTFFNTTDTLAPFDGSLDFAGASGVTHDTSETSSEGTTLDADLVDISPWIGAGMINFDYEGLVTIAEVAAPGNFTSQIITSGRLRWSVRYTFSETSSGLQSEKVSGAVEGGVFDFDTLFVVPQFNTMGGARSLQRVRVAFDFNVSGEGGLESLDLSPGNYLLQYVAEMQVTGVPTPLGNSLITIAESGALSAYDGQTDFLGPSGVTFLIDETNHAEFELTGFLGDNLTPWIGAGDFDLLFSGQVTTATVLGLGNAVIQFNTNGRLEWCVEYLFAEPQPGDIDDPQPAEQETEATDLFVLAEGEPGENNTFEGRTKVQVFSGTGVAIRATLETEGKPPFVCRDVDYFELCGLIPLTDYTVTLGGGDGDAARAGWFDLNGELILGDESAFGFVTDINGETILAVTAINDANFNGVDDDDEPGQTPHGVCNADYTMLVEIVPPAPITAPEDVNRDGLIDTADLGLVLAAFNRRSATTPADINSDGVVDTADLGMVLARFGERSSR